MRRSVLSALVVAVVSAALLLAGAGADAQAPPVEVRWLVTDLGTAGGTGSRAVDINERGQVVGSIRTAGAGSRAFFWSNGRMQRLGTLALGGDDERPDESQAYAINDRGQIIGTSSSTAPGAGPHAFLWFKGKMRDLGCGRVPPARCRVGSVPRALNERGHIVGWTGSDWGTSPTRATVWRNGQMRVLGVLRGRNSSFAGAINERGQIVGTSYTVRADFWTFGFRAFIWENGRMRDLGALSRDEESSAYAVNERGDAIGASSPRRGDPEDGEPDPEVVSRGVLWRSGRMHDLGPLIPLAINDRGQILAVRDRSDSRSVVDALLWENGRTTYLGAFVRENNIAINRRGQIVGSARRANGKPQAVLWESGKLVALATLPGGNASAAVAINERGQVVGWSSTKSGRRHAVRWTPVPRGK